MDPCERQSGSNSAMELPGMIRCSAEGVCKRSHLQEPASFHPPSRLEYAKTGTMARMIDACTRAKHDRHQRLPHRQVRYKSNVDIRVRAQEIPDLAVAPLSSHPARAHTFRQAA
jgi:hypothetical protein